MEVVFTARGHSAMYWVVFLRQCIPPRGLSVCCMQCRPSRAGARSIRRAHRLRDAFFRCSLVTAVEIERTEWH